MDYQPQLNLRGSENRFDNLGIDVKKSQHATDV